MGVSLHGIHFHSGSSANGSNSFQKAVKLAHECMMIGKAMGHPMEILDLGGGFPQGKLPEKYYDLLLPTKG